MSLNTKAIKNENIVVEPAKILEFLQARYYGNTNDEVLANARILNPFRELDKTSKWIYDNVDTLEGMFLARFINRIDVLETIDFTSLKTMKQWLLNYPVKSVLTNSGAYQLHGAINAHKFKNIRQLICYVIEKAPTMVEFYNIGRERQPHLGFDDLTIELNKVFGGGAQFAIFQWLIDCAWTTNDVMLLESKPFVGAGGKLLKFDLNEIKDYINMHWDNKPRKFYPFDVENALCEYRKYYMWSKYGIPNNRKRNK